MPANTEVRPALTRNARKAAKATMQQVYVSDFSVVFNVPVEDLIHIPAVPRLVMCDNFDPANPKASCAKGNECAFVHCDVSRASSRQIHVNHRYRSVDLARYETFPAGDVFSVAAPNETVPTDVIPSEFVARTKALETERRPLCHCAHFLFNRVCNRGDQCLFIHALFVDDGSAEPSSTVVERQRASAAHAATRGVALSDDVWPAPSVSEHASPMDEMSYSTLSLRGQAPPSESIPTPRNSEDNSTASSLRFRHDPYSAFAAMMWCGDL